MANLRDFNPFARRETHSTGSIVTYKIFTVLSWLLLVFTTYWYIYHFPTDGHYDHRTLWDQSRTHPTPFTLNRVFVDIYWIVMWVLQIGYVAHLFSSKSELVTAAASVGSHFILFNLIQFGWVMLFVRAHFWLSELLLVVNFFNLVSLYFRHSTKPRFVHIPVVALPLSWVFVAIFWNGAIMVHSHYKSIAARVIANIAVWSFLGFGGFYLAIFKDYTVGFAMSYLTAALGTGQFLTKFIALQWIFAFVIMAILFIGTVVIGVPTLFGQAGAQSRSHVAAEDRERQPLLDDH